MDINLEEVIKANTNEEGVVNHDAIKSEISKVAQSEIDKVAKKKDDKYKRKLDELTKELEAAKTSTVANTDNNEEPDALAVVDDLQKQIVEMQNATKREKSINSFKLRAKEEGISDETINVLTKSVDNLEELDLTPFKIPENTVTIIDKVKEGNEEDSSQNDMASIMENYRKNKKRR